MSLSTPGEQIWGPKMEETVSSNRSSNKSDSLPIGQGFAIVDIKEFNEKGQLSQILKIRSPLKKFEWRGDWSEGSEKWTPFIL